MYPIGTKDRFRLGKLQILERKTSGNFMVRTTDGNEFYKISLKGRDDEKRIIQCGFSEIPDRSDEADDFLSETDFDSAGYDPMTSEAASGNEGAQSGGKSQEDLDVVIKVDQIESECPQGLTCDGSGNTDFCEPAFLVCWHSYDIGLIFVGLPKTNPIPTKPVEQQQHPAQIPISAPTHSPNPAHDPQPVINETIKDIPNPTIHVHYPPNKTEPIVPEMPTKVEPEDHSHNKTQESAANGSKVLNTTEGTGHVEDSNSTKNSTTSNSSFVDKRPEMFKNKKSWEDRRNDGDEIWGLQMLVNQLSLILYLCGIVCLIYLIYWIYRCTCYRRRPRVPKPKNYEAQIDEELDMDRVTEEDLQIEGSQIMSQPTKPETYMKVSGQEKADLDSANPDKDQEVELQASPTTQLEQQTIPTQPDENDDDLEEDLDHPEEGQVLEYEVDEDLEEELDEYLENQDEDDPENPEEPDPDDSEIDFEGQ